MLEEMRAKRRRMSAGSSQPQAGGQDDDDDDEDLGNTGSGKENVDPNEVLTEEEISKIDNNYLASFLRTWPLSRAYFDIALKSLKKWEDIPEDAKETFDERLPLFIRTNEEDGNIDQDDGGIAHYAPMTKVIEVCMPMFTAFKLEDMTASYKILSKRVTIIEETVQSLKKAKEVTIIEDTTAL
ncbi:hypothetical protein V8E36_005794 [Tilletia maclaganii]